MPPRSRYKDAESEIRNQTRPPMTPLFWYMSSVSRPDIDCFCFVEGKTDHKFYRPFLHTKLGYPKESVEIIYGTGGDGGKTAVIATARKIDAMGHKNGKEAVYIVDRDYDDRNKRQEYPIMRIITVLPCYSFENYVFKPGENLRQIFKDAFGPALWETRYAEFDGILARFLEEILPYSAWKRLCVEEPVVAATLVWHQSGEDRVERELGRSKLTIPYKFPGVARSFIRSAIAELRFGRPDLYEVVEGYMEEMRGDLGTVKGKLLLTLVAQYLAWYGVYGRKQTAVREKLYTFGPRFRVPMKPIKNKI